MAARKRASTSSANTRRPPVIVEDLPPSPIVIEEDDDDDEDKDVEVAAQPPLATFDPSTHGIYALATHDVLTREAHIALLSSKADNDRRALELAKADSQRIESMVIGFTTSQGSVQTMLDNANKFAIEQRDYAERLRRELTAKELEIANMVRSSEDAQLERQRLAADIKRGQFANEQLQMQLEAKLRQREMELNAVKQAAAPVFAAAGQGLQSVIGAWAPKALGAAPQPAQQQGGQAAGGQQPAPYRVNAEGTAEFKRAWQDVFDTLGNEPVACLRAILCSYALGAQGAPPVPKSVLDNLVGLIMRDAAPDKIQALLQACSAAYVAEPPPATTAAVNPQAN